MTRTIRNIFFAAGFMALGGIGSLGMQAVAQGGPGYGRGPGMSMMADLDLTEEQEAQFSELRQAMRDMHAERRDERGGMMREVMQSLQDGDLDAKAIHKEIDQRAQERTEQAHEMADKVIDFVQTLSPEQRSTMLAHMEQMQERRGERMGQRGQRGQRGQCDDCDGMGPRGE